MYRVLCRKCLATVIAFAMVMSLLPSAALTAAAMTNGTGDGTYDFGGLGSANSAGGGYTALGDKFKVADGVYTACSTLSGSAFPGAVTAIYVSAVTYDSSTAVIFAKGDDTCGSFTFKDLGLSAYAEDRLNSLRLVLKDSIGNVLSQYDLGATANPVPIDSIVQLSSLYSRGEWNVAGVSAIEITYDFAGTSNDCLAFENITVSNISSKYFNAETPEIILQPSDLAVNVGQAADLSVTIASVSAGTLAYQWYSNTTDSNIGGSLISGATSQSYSAPTDVISTTYYYCMVTNTDTNATNEVKTVTSNAAEVVVNNLINAEAPTVTIQPQDTTIPTGSTGSISVTASASGTLSYQWYRNTTDSNIGGSLISGATNATYSITPSVVGTTYYYCVITNTDTSVSGNQTASVKSGAAAVSATYGAGTYNFSGLGTPGSAGPGYIRVGDLIKVPEGMFLPTQSLNVPDGQYTALYSSAGDVSTPITLIFHAEGGGTCSSFTFKDLGLSMFSANDSFTSFRLVLKDSSGILSDETLTGPGIIFTDSIVQLSSLYSRAEWNVAGVSTIEITFDLVNNFNNYLTFENITITDIYSNAAPTDITLSGTSILENSATGTAIGTLSTTDPDAGDTHTYSLVSGTGATDNGSFSIVGNELRSSADFDYEEKSSYSIRVRTTDAAGDNYEETFAISVSDVYENPVVGQNGLLSVPEDAASAIISNTYLKTEVNAGCSATYTLTVVPTKGTLKNSGTLINAGDTFTQADIDTSKITYTPGADASGADNFSFSVSDGTNSISDTFSITITAINDAPTLLSGTAITLPATDEDTANVATEVSAILSGAGYTDVDSGALAGIALHGATGNGTWQYSTDSTSWMDVGIVSGSNALLLSSLSYLRYVPDGENGETAAFTFRAWDQTSGTASTNSMRNTADTTTNGGSTAFSAGTATAGITVTDVNDAPTFSATATNPTFTEGGVAAALFSGASANSVEAGQRLTELGLTVAHILNGIHEFLVIDGTDVVLTNGTSGTTASGSIDYSVTVVGDTATVTLTKIGGIADVNALVNGLAYKNTSLAPSGLSRTATLTSLKDDGGTANGGADAAALSVASTVTVSSVNDAPAVSTSGSAIAFVEGANVLSAPVVIGGGITISDTDSITLASGTISITGNYHSGEDVLSFNNTDTATYGNISGTFNAGTGTLTLISAGSSSSLAQWQATLRAVTYTNTSDSPNTSERIISFAVNDGTATSSPATKTITVLAANDTPTDIMLSTSSIFVADTGVSATVGTLSAVDPDAGDTFTFTLVAGTGGEHNASFEINGSNLRTKSLLPAGTYNVRVQVSDGSEVFEKALTVTVINQPAKTLIPNIATNSVDDDMDIYFTPDAAFEAAIHGVSFNGAALIAGTDYVTGSGVIILKPSGGNTVLRTPATADVVITADGYQDSTVTQTITAGRVFSLEVTTQPVPGAETGDLFATQPVVTMRDQYGNICADGPSIPATVPAYARAGTGTWTLGGMTSYTTLNGTVDFDDLTCTLVTPGSGFIHFEIAGVTVDSAAFTIPENNSAISPAAATFDKYTSAAGYQDIAVSVTLNGNTLNSIKNSGYTLAADTDYTVSGNTYTIKREYLSNLSSGSANLTFDFSLGVDRVLTVTVSDSTPSQSSGNGGSSTQTYHADVNAGNNGGQSLPVTVDRNAGSATIDAGPQTSLISDGKPAVITVPSIPNVSTYTLGIPVPDLSTSKTQGSLTVDTEKGSITIPSNMLAGIEGLAGNKAQITIGEGNKSDLPDAVKEAIGHRPLIQLKLDIDGKQADWNNSNAPVTVSIPYTPTAEELAHPDSIVIWYIDGSGNVVTIPSGRYDPARGMVTFDTTHFSDYAVAYNQVHFNDVGDSAWYSKAVSFIAAREITDGTGNGKYSPHAKLKRGEFLVLMMRAYGIASDENPTNNFSDAGNAYYTGYLAAAKRLGISAGLGNNLYAPGKEITRQEMFTILYNALKVIGQLPQIDSGKALSDFADAGQIGSWAKDAMRLLVETGTVGGSAGKLNPTNTTTRAEMAQVLYNLLGQ